LLSPPQAQRVAMARALARLILVGSTLVCAAYSICFFLARDHIIGAFTSDPELTRRAVALWPWVALFIFLDGVMGCQQGFLRALGLQGRMMVIYLVWLWGVGVPLAYLTAFRFGGGAPARRLCPLPVEVGTPAAAAADARSENAALCGLWMLMSPLYLVLDALLIAAYLCKDWGRLARSIYSEAQPPRP
jgi:Na+-driven multidrug efflux pump